MTMEIELFVWKQLKAGVSPNNVWIMAMERFPFANITWSDVLRLNNELKNGH